MSRNKGNDKGRNKRPVKRMIQAGIIAAVAAAAVFAVRIRALAVFNEEKAMRFSEYSSSHTIDDSVMFIGTYLININSMTDELYAKAQESQSESNQTEVYYKSELADGSWFDVTDGEKLTDIMDTGKIVSEDELADLFVQYYVGADGAVIDVMTDSEVNPFDLPDPYNLSKLKELEPLWLQYTNSSSAEEIDQEEYLENHSSDKTGNKRSDVYQYQLLTAFFKMDLRDDETDGYDADLARLFSAYQSMKASGQDEEAEIIYSLMSGVDAARRSIIMDKLAIMEVNALGVLYDLSNGKYYTVSGNFSDSVSDDDLDTEPLYIEDLRDAVSHDFQVDDEDEDEWWSVLQKDYEKDVKTVSGQSGVPYSADSALLDAISTSTENCQQSYNSYQSKALSDADSILGHAEYEYSVQVIEQTSADGAGGPITYLRDIKNIAGSVVKNSDSEKNLLDSSLLNLAEGNFEEAVTSGASIEYSQALSSGAGASAAEMQLNDDFAKAEAKRSELEFLIDAFKQRETAAEALSYVNGCISWTKELYDAVPGDDFKTKADGSIDSHIKWLTDLANEIKNSDKSLKSRLDELNDKKNELQRKRDAALDNNDLSGAKALDKQIEAVDNDIRDEENATGTSSADDLANDILNNALAELAEDPSADVSAAADALAGMGADDALGRLNDRSDASSGGDSGSGSDSGSGGGSGSGSGSGTGSGSGKSSGSGSGSGTGSGSGSGGGAGSGSGSGNGSAGATGSGSGSSTGLDEAGIQNVLNSFFGKDVNEMNADELAVTTAALSRFARAGNTAASAVAGGYAELMRSKDSKYLYNQYETRSPRYISLRTIGLCSSFRYYYDDTRRTATLTSGAKAYVFRTGTDTVNRGGNDEKLKYETVMTRFPYISEADATDLFDCHAEYVTGSTYAVCLTGAMDGRAKELLEALNEAAGIGN
ncbi:MAG: hypothetical protein J5966_05790 [Lachnospiraceae bacterium]|nr:hypothetical protein [Lachnospiraceae bacterium]